MISDEELLKVYESAFNRRMVQTAGHRACAARDGQAMIELRWIDRLVPLEEFGGEIASVVRVLQYRARGYTTMLDGSRIYDNWQDVPLVTDKDAP